MSETEAAPASQDAPVPVSAPTEGPTKTPPKTNGPSSSNPFDLAFSYRHYNALYPHCNKILEQKWDQNRHDQHLKKLAMAKPNVDNKAPKVYGHLQVKLRKLQMDRDRQAQIERNNKILLEKMSYIMQKESQDPAIHGQRYNVIHSRSVASRARQNAKIEEENRLILQRLEAKKGHYNHKQWISDRLKNLTYLQNISAYPGKYFDQKKEYEALQRKAAMADPSVKKLASVAAKKETLPPIEHSGTVTAKQG